MTKRERKWLKGDKWMSFMGGEPFKVPAHHWFMRVRCSKMKPWEYIRWKHQQVIQSELQARLDLRLFGGEFELIQYKPLGPWSKGVIIIPEFPKFLSLSDPAPAPIEYWIPKMFPNSNENDERSVATTPNRNSTFCNQKIKLENEQQNSSSFSNG